MKLFKNQNVKQIFIEIPSIIIAVLLALGANSWWAEREKTAEAENFMNLVNEEVLLNYQNLTQFVDVVNERKDKLQAIIPEVDGSKSFSFYTRFFTGYRFIKLNDFAWRLITNSENSSRLPLKYRIAVLNLYSWNKTLQDLTQIINDRMHSVYFYNPAKAKDMAKISSGFMWQQITWGETMLGRYENFITDFIPEEAAKLKLTEKESK